MVEKVHGSVWTAPKPPWLVTNPSWAHGEWKFVYGQESFRMSNCEECKELSIVAEKVIHDVHLANHIADYIEQKRKYYHGLIKEKIKSGLELEFLGQKRKVLDAYVAVTLDGFGKLTVRYTYMCSADFVVVQLNV